MPQDPPSSLPSGRLTSSTDGSQQHAPATAEALARDSEERLRLAMEAGGMSIWDVDLETGKATWSENHFRFFGYEPNPSGEATFQMWLDRVHPEDREHVLRTAEDAKANRTAYKSEHRIIRANTGEIVWISAAGKFIYDADGQATRIAGVFFDITARKDAEARLRQHLKQLFLIADTAPVYIAHCDCDSRFLFVNNAYAQRFGLRPEDCIGKRIPEIVGEPAYEVFRPHVERVLSGVPVDFELEVPYSDGNHFMHCSYVPEFGPDGKVKGLVAAITDITTRRKVETRLREAQEETSRQFAELEAIYASAPLGLCLLGTDMRFRRINQRLAELNGFTVEEHIGRHVRELLPSIADQGEQVMKQVLQTGQPVRFELRAETPAQPGVERFWDEVWYPIRDAAGIIVAAGVVVEEITERRQAESALRKADRLSAAGRMAATVAHEINNPLSSVVNSLYLLGNEPLDATARHYLELARAELQRVIHITRQTLAFYRTADSPAVFNVADVIDQVVSGFQPVAKRQKVQFEYDTRGAHYLHGFAGEIRQVLTNILNNAVESDATCAHLRVRPGRDWGPLRRRGVRITLSDNGKGIRKQHLAAIFEPFFTTKGEKGTGLGLWVTRGIIAKHEGEIRIRTSVTPGKTGTSISIFLPTLMEHARPSHAPSTATSIA